MLVATVMGTLLAFGLVRSRSRVNRPADVLMLLNLVSPEIVTAIALLLVFSEVGSVALMVSDIDSAHAWVVDTLGPLATHDAQHERLRETLRVFLAAGRSYTAAAATLTMHKNSVQYRVRKAEELLGRDITDNRMDVELALTLCRWLGSAVLTSP